MISYNIDVTFCRAVCALLVELGFRLKHSVMQLLMRSGSSYKMVLLVFYLGKSATLTFLPPLPVAVLVKCSCFNSKGHSTTN